MIQNCPYRFFEYGQWGAGSNKCGDCLKSSNNSHSLTILNRTVYGLALSSTTYFICDYVLECFLVIYLVTIKDKYKGCI